MESEGELDIQKEIAELYDSSSIHEDVGQPHKLRQRAKVDYTIPPPTTADFQLNMNIDRQLPQLLEAEEEEPVLPKRV